MKRSPQIAAGTTQSSQNARIGSTPARRGQTRGRQSDGIHRTGRHQELHPDVRENERGTRRRQSIGGIWVSRQGRDGGRDECGGETNSRP